MNIPEMENFKTWFETLDKKSKKKLVAHYREVYGWFRSKGLLQGVVSVEILRTVNNYLVTDWSIGGGDSRSFRMAIGEYIVRWLCTSSFKIGKATPETHDLLIISGELSRSRDSNCPTVRLRRAVIKLVSKKNIGEAPVLALPCEFQSVSHG